MSLVKGHHRQAESGGKGDSTPSLSPLYAVVLRASYRHKAESGGETGTGDVLFLRTPPRALPRTLPLSVAPLRSKAIAARLWIRRRPGYSSSAEEKAEERGAEYLGFVFKPPIYLLSPSLPVLEGEDGEEEMTWEVLEYLPAPKHLPVLYSMDAEAGEFINDIWSIDAARFIGYMLGGSNNEGGGLAAGCAARCEWRVRLTEMLPPSVAMTTYYYLLPDKRPPSSRAHRSTREVYDFILARGGEATIGELRRSGIEEWNRALQRLVKSGRVGQRYGYEIGDENTENEALLLRLKRNEVPHRLKHPAYSAIVLTFQRRYPASPCIPATQLYLDYETLAGEGMSTPFLSYADFLRKVGKLAEYDIIEIVQGEEASRISAPCTSLPPSPSRSLSSVIPHYHRRPRTPISTSEPRYFLHPLRSGVICALMNPISPHAPTSTKAPASTNADANPYPDADTHTGVKTLTRSRMFPLPSFIVPVRFEFAHSGGGEGSAAKAQSLIARGRIGRGVASILGVPNDITNGLGTEVTEIISATSTRELLRRHSETVALTFMEGHGYFGELTHVLENLISGAGVVVEAAKETEDEDGEGNGEDETTDAASLSCTEFPRTDVLYAHFLPPVRLVSEKKGDGRAVERRAGGTEKTTVPLHAQPLHAQLLPARYEIVERRTGERRWRPGQLIEAIRKAGDVELEALVRTQLAPATRRWLWSLVGRMRRGRDVPPVLVLPPLYPSTLFCASCGWVSDEVALLREHRWQSGATPPPYYAPEDFTLIVRSGHRMRTTRSPFFCPRCGAALTTGYDEMGLWADFIGILNDLLSEAKGTEEKDAPPIVLSLPSLWTGARTSEAKRATKKSTAPGQWRRQLANWRGWLWGSWASVSPLLVASTLSPSSSFDVPPVTFAPVILIADADAVWRYGKRWGMREAVLFLRMLNATASSLLPRDARRDTQEIRYLLQTRGFRAEWEEAIHRAATTPKKNAPLYFQFRLSFAPSYVEREGVAMALEEMRGLAREFAEAVEVANKTMNPTASLQFQLTWKVTDGYVRGQRTVYALFNETVRGRRGDRGKLTKDGTDEVSSGSSRHHRSISILRRVREAIVCRREIRFEWLGYDWGA